MTEPTRITHENWCRRRTISIMDSIVVVELNNRHLWPADHSKLVIHVAAKRAQTLSIGDSPAWRQSGKMRSRTINFPLSETAPYSKSLLAESEPEADPAVTGGDGFPRLLAVYSARFCRDLSTRHGWLQILRSILITGNAALVRDLPRRENLVVSLKLDERVP